jgi:N-acetylglucosamine-6-sulfatase
MEHLRLGAWPALLPVALMVAVLTTQVPADVSGPAYTGARTTPPHLAAQPNILLITTDDQNRGDLRWMPKTRRLLGGHGVTFTQALSPDPLCCPARAEFLTGQLGQNNGVRSNRGPSGGFHALLDGQNTLAAWLQAAGYQTAMVGKYLNGYESRDGRQAGWTVWNPSISGEYSYIDTTFFGDGTPTRFTKNVTPVIAHYTVGYIREFAGTGQPFFIWASHLAPHGREVAGGHFTPPLPTRRHRDDLRQVRSPTLSKPSYNALGTRPWPYPELAHHVGRAYAQDEYTRRLQSLLDVDDAVARAVGALRDAHQLRNTYVILVSDNANLMGEHGIDGKDVLYREALEIPLVVRVPGSTRPQASSMPVNLTDLTSTILDLSGATAGRLQDGTSLVPILRGHALDARDTQLIQTGNPTTGSWSFRGVWTRRYTYFRRSGDGVSFLYDHRKDPYELHNVARSLHYHGVRTELRRRASVLETCAGPSCNKRFGPPPRPR